MKRIKIFLSIMFAALPLQVEANKHIDNYFTKIYENEKLELLACIKKEGSQSPEFIDTKCTPSDLFKDAAYFLYNNKNLSPYDVWNDSGEYKPIKKFPAFYPRQALERGITGYAIVKFNLSKEGTTFNAEIQEGKCGNIMNPYSKLKDCNLFNRPSLNAANKLTYKPRELEGKKIEVRGLLHRFSFVLEDVELTVRNGKSRAYNNVLKALSKKNFEEAISIAESNLEFDYIFMSHIANAKYQQGNYLEAKNWLNKFKYELLNDQREIPEDMHVRSFIIFISSLFSLGEYEELITLEPEFNDYIQERKKYNELLAMTNFYFGVSYINTGNIYKGAYYLGLAAKNSTSKAESDYVDSVIDKISSYL
jgi:hypothetical protein